MENQKIEDIFNVSLNITEEERAKSEILEAGFNPMDDTWEIIVRYVGNINVLREKYPEIQIRELINQYAIIITPEKYIEAISNETIIEYVEKPKPLYFQLQVGKAQSCINSVQQGVGNPYGLTGKGVITAIIDTGINPENTEFLNEDGTTRILNIWDQTTDVETDMEEINQALVSRSMSGIPGRDILGHGTEVATIACGKSGVAFNSDIIVVKLGVSGERSFPRTTQIMEAVDYVIRKSIEYEKPVAVNLSIGNNYGDHTGTSLLETFLNDAAGVWKNIISVGAGNEGLGATHAGGNLVAGSQTVVELAISQFETNIDIQIWKDYRDDYDVEIIMPDGRNLGKISRYNTVNKIDTGTTMVITYYGTPTPYSGRQEIYINIIPSDIRQETDTTYQIMQPQYIQAGTWKIKLTPVNIVNGRYDMWLPAISSLNENTGFLQPDGEYTYTIPSVAQNVISVGAYNAANQTVAPFTGRGYVTQIGGTTISKPDIVAPGVDVVIPKGRNIFTSGSTIGGGRVSGTSFAAPFVTGGAALLMEWGIVRGNDEYLYSQKLKAYLIKGARHLPGFTEWPNPVAGWGALCVKSSLPT